MDGAARSPIAPAAPPTVSPHRAETAILALERALGPSRVESDRDTLERFAADDSGVRGELPCAVVHANGPEDVRKALALAAEFRLPVTPRAAGTSRTGGASPVQGGIVLLTLGWSKLVDVDRREHLAVLEPGHLLGAFQSQVEAEGLFYPPDPGSQTGCSIGGTVATNAGGPRGFKYGVTGDYVLGVDAILPNGEHVHTGRRTSKGVTGYDLTSLMVGSEGTLAVLGNITVRLLRKPERVATLLSVFDDEVTAAEAVVAIVSSGVRARCVEFLDEVTLGAIRDSGTRVPERARALLITEVDGDETECARGLQRLGEALTAAHALEVRAAMNDADRDQLWSTRRAMSYSVRQLAKHKVSEDVAVPRTRLPELLRFLRGLREERGLRVLSYGHAGDGNLHVNFLWNDVSERAAVDAGIESLFREVIRLQGTLSGEHGLGALKAPFLPLEQSAGLITLQRQLKAVFDPHGLLNPGKVLPESRPVW